MLHDPTDVPSVQLYPETPPPPIVAPKESRESKNKPRDPKKEEQVIEVTPTPPAPPAKPSAKPKKETNGNSFPWDTSSSADGVYVIKVVASDKYARPIDVKSSEAQSGSFTIDNTPPTASLKDTAVSWDEVKKFIITDNLTPLVGGKFRIDEGQWVAIVAEDGFFDRVSETVLLSLPDGEPKLTAGDHKLAIYATDSAGNKLERTLTITIVPPPTPAPAEAVKP